MQNACADLHWHGDIPITQAHPVRSPDASYITSLRSGWFDYAANELENQKFLSYSVRTVGQVANLLGLDQLVLVGNFPISTNTWSAQNQAVLIETCMHAMHVFPTQFIGIRNLQKNTNTSLISALRSKGFYALPARVVYEFDLREDLKYKHSHLMRDQSALAKSDLKADIRSEISDAEAVRLRDLYQEIYIHKHSTLNAQYTAQFFFDMVNSQVMKILLLRNKQGIIIAFSMLYQQEDTLTVPALGYATEVGINGLYRFLFAAIHQYTQDQSLLLNYSSGAGDFKRKRGGKPRIEYTLLRAPTQWKRCLIAWLEQRLSCVEVDDLIKLGA